MPHLRSRLSVTERSVPTATRLNRGKAAENPVFRALTRFNPVAGSLRPFGRHNGRTATASAWIADSQHRGNIMYRTFLVFLTGSAVFAVGLAGCARPTAPSSAV